MTILSDSAAFLRKREFNHPKAKVFLAPPKPTVSAKPICDHCEFLKILDLANIDELSHNPQLPAN